MRNHRGHYGNNLVSEVEGKEDRNGKEEENEEEEEICMYRALHLFQAKGQKPHISYLMYLS